MAKRSGRRSAADIAAAKFTSSIQPTRKLTPAEAKYWKLIISAWPDGHFITSDAILISHLVGACVAFDGARDLQDISAMDKAARLALSLCTRLRITPQSRYDERGASRQAARGRSIEVVKKYDRLIASAPNYQGAN
jgi:hypothetical protein